MRMSGTPGDDHGDDARSSAGQHHPSQLHRRRFTEEHCFYEALGFTVDERWEDNGTLLGVMMRAGKHQIGLSQDDWKKGRDRKKGIGMRVYLSTTRTSTRSRRGPGAPASSSRRTARHRVEEPGVRGHRSERVLADDLVGNRRLAAGGEDRRRTQSPEAPRRQGATAETTGRI